MISICIKKIYISNITLKYIHLGSQLHPVILSLPSVHQFLEGQIVPVIKNINVAVSVNVTALSHVKKYYLMFRRTKKKLKWKTAL